MPAFMTLAITAVISLIIGIGGTTLFFKMNEKDCPPAGIAGGPAAVQDPFAHSIEEVVRNVQATEIAMNDAAINARKAADAADAALLSAKKAADSAKMTAEAAADAAKNATSSTNTVIPLPRVLVPKPAASK